MTGTAVLPGGTRQTSCRSRNGICAGRTSTATRRRCRCRTARRCRCDSPTTTRTAIRTIPRRRAVRGRSCRAGASRRRRRRGVRTTSGDARAHNYLATKYLQSGSVLLAQGQVRRSVSASSHRDAHFNLAVLLGPRNQLDEAIAHLRRVIEINPRNADARRNLAVGLGLQGKLEEAIRHDQTSLRLQPDSAAAREHLNALLKASGKPRIDVIWPSLVAQRCGTSLDTTDNCPYYWGLRS